MNGIARDRKIVGEENRPERPLLAPMPPTLPAATNTASGLACAMKRSTASEWRKSSSRRVALIISHPFALGAPHDGGAHHAGMAGDINALTAQSGSARSSASHVRCERRRRGAFPQNPTRPFRARVHRMSLCAASQAAVGFRWPKVARVDLNEHATVACRVLSFSRENRRAGARVFPGFRSSAAAPRRRSRV